VLEVKMAKKGKKTAVRQSQLNSRKRKKSKNLQVVDSRVSDPILHSEEIISTDSESDSSHVENIRKTDDRKPVKSSSQNAAALSYPYLNRELIQIGLTSLAVVAVLVGLNFTVFS
tara:strand:+ start:1869 stop:2213 length:345 start_codon:yes stop_codon:yes gene_type:complete